MQTVGKRVYERRGILGRIGIRLLSTREITFDDNSCLEFCFISMAVFMTKDGHSTKVAEILDCDRKSLNDFVGTIRVGQVSIKRAHVGIAGRFYYWFVVGDKTSKVDPFPGRNGMSHMGINLEINLHPRLSESVIIQYNDPGLEVIAKIFGTLWIFDMNYGYGEPTG
jgi:hypothetical protein